MESTGPLCPRKTNIGRPVSTSKLRIVWSIDAVKSVRPLSSVAMELMAPMWPRNVRTHMAVSSNHDLAVQSPDPVTIRSLNS